MRFARLLGLLLAAFLLLGACPLPAQDLTLFVGGNMPGDLERDGGKIRLDNGPVWGFRLRWGFIPLLGFEQTVAFSPDYLFPKDTSVPDSKGFICNSNLILQLPTGRIVPYGTFGIGLIWQYGSPNLPVGAEFAFNYGGGLKFPRMWGPFGLRFDARGYTVPEVLSTKLNMFELSAGLLISF
jgi:hypothetical protein